MSGIGDRMNKLGLTYTDRRIGMTNGPTATPLLTHRTFFYPQPLFYVISPITMEIDITQELYDHYERLKTFYRTLENDGAARDQISALNAITSMIKELAKTQEELYNSTTYAIFQEIFINTLKEIEPKKTEHLLDLLEVRLNEIES